MKVCESALWLNMIVLLLTTSGVAQESRVIYKWVDQEGNLHFEDCPPDPAEIAPWKS